MQILHIGSIFPTGIPKRYFFGLFFVEKTEYFCGIGRQHMAVCIERLSNVGVTETLADGNDRDAVGYQIRRAAMTQIVQPDLRQPRKLDVLMESSAQRSISQRLISAEDESAAESTKFEHIDKQ